MVNALRMCASARLFLIPTSHQWRLSPGKSLNTTSASERDILPLTARFPQRSGTKNGRIIRADCTIYRGDTVRSVSSRRRVVDVLEVHKPGTTASRQTHQGSSSRRMVSGRISGLQLAEHEGRR